MRLLLCLLLLGSGRPLVYWGATPPVIVAEPETGGPVARVTEVHARRDAADLVVRFSFDRPVASTLHLADGTPVSGRLSAVLYFDADDDRATGLEADPTDLRAGADRRLEIGVMYVGDDPSEGRGKQAVITATLWSLRPGGGRRTLWRSDIGADPGRVSAYSEWVDVRIPAAVLELGPKARLVLADGSRCWGGSLPD